ncbi:MAG TPA: hypothetical protein VFZ91_05520 [Allosphingosinicella sp.]
MKKIAITLAAVAALGAAACTPSSDDAGNNAVDVNATEIEAGNDINAAADANAISVTDNALEDAGNAVANTASDAANVATDAGNAVADVVD